MKPIFKILLLLCLYLTLPCTVFADDVVNKEAAQSAERIKIDADSFIEGNLYFLAYHELGHALVSEFNLPILGREEDAVDSLATYLMTPEDKAVHPDYLMAAMKGWFLFASEIALDDIAWWDAHGTDNQRGYQISCLLYGSDPTAFKEAADVVNLPENRRESCETDAEQMGKSWDKLLSPYYAANDGSDNVTAPEVIYRDTKTYNDQVDYLKEHKLLESLSDFMRQSYKFKPGIKIIAEECGESNSFWYPKERELYLCYELVADFQRLAAKIEH
jgi:hypothetical protein